MTTFKLFEHSTSTAAGQQKYYVRMESTFPSQIYMANMERVTVSEKFGVGSPVCSIKFNDTVGSLVNEAFISPEVTYNLFIGPDFSTAVTPFPFMLSGMSAQSTTSGDMSNVGTDVAFMGASWLPMLNTSHSRSFGSVLVSDVVNQIATECGFTNINIEPTDTAINIIQPYWSDYKMLQWLAVHARSASGNVGYDFVVGADNSFTFGSYSFMNKKPPVRNLFFLGRGSTSVQIYGLKIEHAFANAMHNTGGTGLTSYYFDYASRSFKNSTADITGVDLSQLSDWASLPTSLVGHDNSLYGALDVDTGDIVAQGIIARANNNALKISFTMLGDIGLHTGDVVNILVNTNDQLNNQINELYSGYWLISGLTHVIDFEHTIFNTQVECIRAGVNGTNVTNMSKSSAGKNLAPVPANLPTF